MQIGNVLEDLFTQNQFMAAMIVNNEGIILSMSDTYMRLLNLPKEKIIGRPVKEVTPNTRVFTVLTTGKAMVGYNWKVNDRNMIASTIPIFKEGKVVGAFAYSVFPDIWDAKNLVENLLSELNMYRDEVDSLYTAKHNFEDIVGDEKRFKKIKAFAQQIANHPYTTVLITGESGTGKELIAHAIHNNSCRAKFHFLRINCAAIPENLLEAELFGYEEGAFTGAKKGGKPGKFELANGGTIFLDEIGEMSLSMQSKLLVVLQEQVIERLGGNHPVRVNVRVIAATNRNLELMIEEKKFREDLFYRLNVVHLEMPPLRKRKEDIPILTRHLIEKLNLRLCTMVAGISAEALDLLGQYPWPGNIRELENALERAIILADMENTAILNTRHFAFLNNRYDFQLASPSQSLKSATQEFEKEVIIKTLNDTDFNIIKTAEYLEIDLSSLYRKIRKYNIKVKE
ncbi:MAG: sigma 54-interacting transcriptional regulator [Syntrophomonadaceae bacterium]|nr:sigma 54-interacting transcriptional regulator [Syntrophomonadaceae bacterium]